MSDKVSAKVSAKVSNRAAQIELKFQALLRLQGGELSQFTDIEPSLWAPNSLDTANDG